MNYEHNEIKIKEATYKDLKILYKWFNAKEDLQYKLVNNKQTNLNEHKIWFKKILNDKKSKIYLFELNKIPVGQVRFETKNDLVKISFSVDISYREKGFGKNMLSLAMKSCNLINKYYFAQVKNFNTPSIKIFRSLNFNEKYENDIYEFTKKISHD